MLVGWRGVSGMERFYLDGVKWRSVSRREGYLFKGSSVIVLFYESRDTISIACPLHIHYTHTHTPLLK